MTNKEIELLYHFLDYLNFDLENSSCDDFAYPKDWTDDEIKDLGTKINKTLELEDPEGTTYYSAFVIFRYLYNKLRKHLENIHNSGY